MRSAVYSLELFFHSISFEKLMALTEGMPPSAGPWTTHSLLVFYPGHRPKDSWMYEFFKAFEHVTLFYKTKLVCLQIEIILPSISGPLLSFGRTFLPNVHWVSLYSMPSAEPEARRRESGKSWPVRPWSSGSGGETDSETAHWSHGTTTLLDVQRVTGAAGSPVLLA